MSYIRRGLHSLHEGLQGVLVWDVDAVPQLVREHCVSGLQLLG